jgi:hypothetical protein
MESARQTSIFEQNTWAFDVNNHRHKALGLQSWKRLLIDRSPVAFNGPIGCLLISTSVTEIS